MLAQKELLDEIREIVVARIDAGLTIETIPLAEEIMESHPLPKTGDVDFYELCGWRHVRVSIRIVMRDYKLLDPDDKQLRLEGCEHVQKGYCIELNGEPRIIPTEKMSREQLIAKAEELREMAAGCLEHADELDRYRIDKFGE